MDEREDQLLTEQFLAGSADAYKELFNRYYKPLCAFACKYLLDLAPAEDVVQNLFVRLWDQRARLRLKTSLKSYLFQSTRNECLNYLKRQQVSEKYRLHHARVSNDRFFHDRLEEEELNHCVHKTIQSLPPRCRQIFEMSRVEGKSFEEIAKELAISKNTVKNQIVSALKQIRQALEKEGLIMLIMQVMLFPLHLQKYLTKKSANHQ